MHNLTTKNKLQGHWDNLPNEIVQLIFTFVPLADFANLELISKDALANMQSKAFNKQLADIYKYEIRDLINSLRSDYYSSDTVTVNELKKLKNKASNCIRIQFMNLLNNVNEFKGRVKYKGRRACLHEVIGDLNRNVSNILKEDKWTAMYHQWRRSAIILRFLFRKNAYINLLRKGRNDISVYCGIERYCKYDSVKPELTDVLMPDLMITTTHTCVSFVISGLVGLLVNCGGGSLGLSASLTLAVFITMQICSYFGVAVYKLSLNSTKTMLSEEYLQTNNATRKYLTYHMLDKKLSRLLDYDDVVAAIKGDDEKENQFEINLEDSSDEIVVDETMPEDESKCEIVIDKSPPKEKSNREIVIDVSPRKKAKRDVSKTGFFATSTNNNVVVVMNPNEQTPLIVKKGSNNKNIIS